MAYTSDKKPGGLTQVTSLGDNDNVVVDQSGSVKRATLNQLESKIFDAKTGVSPVTGAEVVVVRRTDDTLGQVALSNVVPDGNITNTKIAAINSPSYLGITDNKLATINTAGKVTNQAVQATSANTADRIVARDGSGNFAAGTITATLSGNASTATTASTATALATGRTIAMTGDVTYTSPSFDGTSNVTAASTLANSGVVAGTYNNVATEVQPFTVDAKGRVTNVGTAVKITPNYADVIDSPYKNGVRLATTANLTATYSNGSSGVGATLQNSGVLGVLSVDGVSATANDRILVKDQTNAAHNGIYSVTNPGSASVAWVLTRSTDSDTNAETGGAVVTVDRGASNGGKLFSTNFESTETIGTTAQNWYQVVTTGDSQTVSETMVANNAVANSKIRDSAALSVIGRSANSVGDPADIAAGTDGHVLRRSGTTLGFGQIVEAGIADNAVSNAKLRNSAPFSVIGRSSSSTGDVADIVASTDGHVLRRSGTSIGFGQIVNSGIANNAITESKIADSEVTFYKLALPSDFPIQVVQAVKTNTQTLSDDDVWTDILTKLITKRADDPNGSVRIQAVIQHSSNNGSHAPMFRIVRGTGAGTAIGLADAAGSRVRTTAASFYPNSNNSIGTTVIDFIDTTPGWSALAPFVTYRIQAKTYSSVVSYINRSNSDTDAANYSPRSISTLTLTELSP